MSQGHSMDLKWAKNKTDKVLSFDTWVNDATN